MLGIHDLWLFIASGLLLNVDAGSRYRLHRRAQRAIGMAGRRGCRARNQHRLLRPCFRRRDRPFGAARGLLDGLYDREMGRRGLSLRHWYHDAAVATAGERRQMGESETAPFRCDGCSGRAR